MAVDWFLIILAIVMSGVVIGMAGMGIVYFQHPDDSNTAWLPKFIVLFSLYVASSNVMILPFDVSNAQTGGGLDVELMWSISMIITAVMLLAVIPFAYFYYENDNDPNESTSGCCGLIPYWNSQLCEGLKWALGFMIAFGILFAILYTLLRFADIPVTRNTYNWASATNRVSDPSSFSTVDLSCVGLNCKQSEITVEIEVTFPVYVMAMLAFLGWFLFVAFVGMGLPALPWDLYNEWKFRPSPIGLEKWTQEKKKIGERAMLLKEAGEALKRDERSSMGKKIGRKERKEMTETFHRFENAVYLLKRDWYHLQIAYEKRGGNPLIYWFKLLGAIIGGSISLMWIIHICIFILPSSPVHPFLNNLFVELELPNFRLMGVIAFACYSMWLLLCVVKGNFRYGLRIAFCRMFPMEVNNTMMNAFLANCWLIVLTSVVVVQFSAMAFPIYARNTQVDLLFGTQIRYLRFFTYFFDNNVFVYALLIFSFLACVSLFLCPKNPGQKIEKELEDLMKKKQDITRRDLEMANKGRKK